MKRKTLVLGAAGALAVAGGGAAIAATQGNSKEDSQAIINDAAKQLGVAPGALSDALKTALKNRIDEAVASGRMTKEQGEELKARIDAGGAPLVGGLHGGADHAGHFGGLDTASSYLGLTEAQLREQLSSGKTLAQVAEDRGKSVDGLVNAMIDGAKEKLDAAVTAGRLSRAEADRVLADMKERIADFVNGKAPGFRGGFRGGFRPHDSGGSFFGGPFF